MYACFCEAIQQSSVRQGFRGKLPGKKDTPLIMQGGVVFKSGLPIEKHAAKIYTRVMFEKFQEFLYKAMSYDVDEVEVGVRYVAKHVDCETREKWCKSEYLVTRSDDFFSCECFMYEHMGMLCSHVLKVLVHLRIKEIPDKHIMKRWTVDARDILPCHLVQYQKDSGLVKSFSYRHSQLYLNAMEMVRLGDTNVEAYQAALAVMKDSLPKIASLAVEGDGLGLEERTRAKKTRTTVMQQGARVVDMLDRESGGTAVSLDRSLLAPAKARSGGRPTSSRDKPPYEATSKRTRFCTICREPGHKSTTCPLRQPGIEKPRKAAKCSNCGLAGHRKNNCIQNNVAV